MDRSAFVRSLAAALAVPGLPACPQPAGKPFNVLVFGDSIAWGQGLEPDHRWRSLVECRIAGALQRPAFEVPSDIHSGATIGIGDRGQIEERPRDHVGRDLYTPRYADAATASAARPVTADFELSFLDATPADRNANFDGEIPSSTPTVLRQIDEFDAGPYRDLPIDLIFVSAGINDVGVTRLLDPLASRTYVREAIDAHCRHHLVALLDRMRVRFIEPNPSCLVAVLSYYPMIGPKSLDVPPTRELLAALLTSPTATRKQANARGIERGAVSLPAEVGVAAPPERQTALVRELVGAAARFNELSERAIGLAVDEANRAPFSPNFVHVVPGIDPDRTVFSSDAELWSLRQLPGGQLGPEDEVARARIPICHRLGDDLHDLAKSATQQCDIASLGHPNDSGAQQYADAIWAAIEPKLGAR
jgi:lysophospholipase L1-like esterase